MFFFFIIGFQMSIRRKESTHQGGLRVATDDPHLVSLGGGRLSTAVTIHHLPLGTYFFANEINKPAKTIYSLKYI